MFYIYFTNINNVLDLLDDTMSSEEAVSKVIS